MNIRRKQAVPATAIILLFLFAADAFSQFRSGGPSPSSSERLFEEFSYTGAFATAQPSPVQMIPVGNVDELYAAVNDPGNAGAALMLAPGVFMLSSTDPSGAPRPNGGRLDLQENMSLIGQEGDRSAVVIDAFALPSSSYVVSGQRFAAIRMGRGRNSIEWLTVRDARFGFANIDTSLHRLPGTAYARVAHVAATGSQRGLDVSTRPGSDGRTIEADIVDNHFFFNTQNGYPTQGFRLVNSRGSGNVINARVIGNSCWGQLFGLLVENNAATNSTINIFSSGNRFFGNGAGALIGGATTGSANPANGNTVVLEAHGDQFVENTNTLVPGFNYDHGGLVVAGGETFSIPYSVNNNTVNISLWGCRMRNNHRGDLIGIGAASYPESIGAPGVNNHVTIEIHGEGNANGGWQPVEVFLNSVPFDETTTNSVTVLR